jgi:hypothetical protein
VSVPFSFFEVSAVALVRTWDVADVTSGIFVGFLALESITISVLSGIITFSFTFLHCCNRSWNLQTEHL